MKKIFLALFFVAVNFKLVAQGPLVTGKIIDTVRCQANDKQSYALYLPKKYNRAATWPVIFFYDPSARGNFPLKLYKDLAEKYQFIFVGSNNSRNGPFNVTQEAEQSILKDVESKLSIAKNRLFISGFSGGARASVYLAMQRKIYAGIIACGAAFPVADKLSVKDNIPFIETVGNQDMNFSEAIEADDYLKKISYPHSLIFFDGTHSWPPPNVFDQAIFWQTFRLQPPTKSLMTNYNMSLLSMAKEEIESGNLLMAYENLTHAISFSPRIDSLKKSILANPLYDSQLKNFPKVLQNEMYFLQQFYADVGQFNYATDDSAFDETQWNNKLNNLKKYSKSTDVLEVQMSERVLQFERIASFEYYRQQLGARHYLQAFLAAKVYVLLQPDYNAYLLLARVCVKTDRKYEAVQALGKSAELGLSDTAVIKEFSMLASEKKFNTVKQQVELNAKKSGH